MVEGVARVQFAGDFLLHFLGHHQRVAIDLAQALVRHGVFHRVEIRQVGQQEAQRIADAAVAFGHALEDLVGDRQLAGVVGGRHPQAQDVGAQAVVHLLRCHHVALGLRHLQALAVYHEAVGQQLLVRRAADGGATGKQRGLEPAAVLVGAFQVQVGRPRQLCALLEHGKVGGAGVEPHVQRVGELAVVGRIVAQQLGGVQAEPGFDALLLDAQRHLFQQLGRTRVQLAAFLVDEEGHRHAPVTLARHAPVRAVADHGFQAGAAPGREELGAVYRLLGTLAQYLAVVAGFVHADEPLRRGTEDDRGFVTPAVRVAVQQLVHVHQRATLSQRLDDFGVGFPDGEAGKQLGAGPVATVVGYRVVYRNTVCLADLEVFQTVGRGGVHQAGTGVGGNVIAADYRYFAGVERVRKADQLQLLAAGFAQHGPAFHAVAFHGGFHQVFGQDQLALGAVHQLVGQLGANRNRLVGRQRPRRGGPDHRHGAVNVGHTKGGGQLVGIHHAEAHVDGRRGLVFVFHFGFGQRGATLDAPVHRLFALDQVTVLEDFAQGAHDVGFGLEVHRQVRVVPVAQHAQTDEVFLLAGDLFVRVLAAQLAKFGRRNVLAMQLFHHQLDGQTVAVPARYVRGIETGQRLGADNDVLQHLVHRVTDVDITVGVRRAVVQDEFGAAGGQLAQLLVTLLLGPALQPGGFAFGQVTAHGKRGVQQVDGFTVVDAHA